MGRPYATEIGELYNTYVWSLEASVDRLVDSVVEMSNSSLLAIGSGGSLTSAHFAALLHTRFTGRAAQTLTPYELIGSAQSLESSSVLICSARGSNPDVLTCAANAADRVPHHLCAITTRVHSKLEELLSDRSWPSCHEFQTPTKKDGFLATNSLLATVVLLTRAYHQAFEVDPQLPSSLEKLLHPRVDRDVFEADLAERFSSVCNRSTLIALHGLSTKPAAADLESRYTEAAFGAVQVADYRNFAHGRHHWLAVHASTSAVVAFTTPQDQVTAKRTLSLIPKTIPRQSIAVEDSPNGTLAAICYSLFIARVAGLVKEIDPGRPKVPMFGRKLYHLKASIAQLNGIHLSDRARTAIQRKSGLAISTLVLRDQLDHWIEAYTAFLAALGKASIRAIVFDYDGTLCGPSRRYDGPRKEIVSRLTELLDDGILVAIATGRGKSVREALLAQIRSSRHRQQVIIGYHNCAEIGTLGDSSCPPQESAIDDQLVPIVNRLRANPFISQVATIQAKGKQITIERRPHSESDTLFSAICEEVREAGATRVSVVTSTHSIDVLAPGVSKQSLIDHLTSTQKIAPSDILCIGDRGQWPGNDWELLTHPLSLSVDQVSQSMTSCWNVGAPDQRFDATCLAYLELIVPRKRGARFKTQALKP